MEGIACIAILGVGLVLILPIVAIVRAANAAAQIRDLEATIAMFRIELARLGKAVMERTDATGAPPATRIESLPLPTSQAAPKPSVPLKPAPDVDAAPAGRGPIPPDDSLLSKLVRDYAFAPGRTPEHGSAIDAPQAAPARAAAIPGATDANADERRRTSPPDFESRPRRTDSAALEQRFGVRIAAWLGAISLFLAGVYLVKYTFDQGLLTPTARVVIGTVFGVVMLGIGEFLRKRSTHVAQGLTAAGVADLFACFLAATRLYALVSPTVGFLLLAGTTLLAIVLSLRQGPFVALLGLIGGFFTPALIGSTEPQPGFLFGYLLLLEVGLLGVTTRRGWWPLAGLTAIGAFGWAALWMTQLRPQDTGVLGPFLIVSTFAILVSTWRRSDSTAGGRDINRVVGGIAGALVGTFLLVGMTGAAGYQGTDWLFIGVLGAGALGLGRWDERYRAFPTFTAILSALLLIRWTNETRHFRADDFAATLAALAAVYALGGYLALWRSKTPPYWAAISSLAAIAYALLGYWYAPPPVGVSWPAVTVAIAVVYALAATPVYRARERMTNGNLAFALLAIAVTALLSCAVPMQLQREWFAVAWALEIPALVILMGRLRTPELRVPIAGLTIATIGMLVQPDVLNYPMGTQPVFNWLLYGYGVPAAAIAIAAWLLARQGRRQFSEWLCGGATLLAFALVTLEARHYFQGGAIAKVNLGLPEAATYVALWCTLAIAWAARRRRVESAALRGAIDITAALAAAFSVGVLCVYMNPLWHMTPLSPTPIWNDLLFVYGIPAVMLGITSFLLARWQSRAVGEWVAGAAAIMLLMLITTEGRHFFHRNKMTSDGWELLETATYVCGWSVLAIAWTIRERFADSPALRAAARVSAALASTALLAGLCVAQNPVWTRTTLSSTRIWNELLVAYGLTALMVALVGRALRLSPRISADASRGRLPDQMVHHLVALCGVFTLVTLEVRQWYHGARLDGPMPQSVELYAYSAAWIGLGFALLGAAIATQAATLRWSSLLVMLLAVGKVFLYDTANLQDLYRVFSLLGLGVSLMLLAWVYQKFVFRPRRVAGAADSIAPGSDSPPSRGRFGAGDFTDHSE